ncbi:GTPase IMAP family member 2 [Astyanax mexicanus]|uniref:GTPase IMAP family member 2 n=1 Tax=Astyanax mexicanus TaxID=7994 RepID=UPI0020CB1DC0|nr:GTPase IMAP family member 2 [Astyanax mexicanus]
MGQAEAKSETRPVVKSRLQRIKKHIRGKSTGKSKVLQLVLVGPQGSGKSSAGNSILGRAAFTTDTRTPTCQTETGEIGSRTLTVVDTPGLTGDLDSDQEVIETISKACQDLLELPIIFLLVVPLGWNAEKSQDGSVPHVLKHALGKVSLDHLMVLVSYTDQDQQDTSENESFLRKGGHLKLTVDQCGGWYHLFNIVHMGGTQFSELLDKLEKMMHKGKKMQEFDADPEEQFKAFSKTPINQREIPKQQGPIQNETPVSATPERKEEAGGMSSVRKNIQKLENQMKREREVEEEHARQRNLEYRAQLLKIREMIVTLKK